MMTIKLFKNKKYIIIKLILLGLLISIPIVYYKTNKPESVLSEQTNLPVLSENQLGEYDGSDPNKPIYIGLDGYVYDVTTGKKFYEPGAAYHELAGKDSTDQLRIFGGDIIKRKYPIVAILKK